MADAIHDRCPNCDAPLSGPYCASCGQRVADLDPTLRELLRDAAYEITNLDGKFWVSLRALCRPGLLTEQFFAGRRARYLSPIRLYLVLSVVYFAAAATLPERSEEPGAGSGRAPVVIGYSFGEDSVANRRVIDSLVASSSGIRRRFYRGLGIAAQENRTARTVITGQFGKAMFLLVPFFGLLLALVYHRRRLRYPRHLYFAVHFHAFVFLTLLVPLIVRNVAGRLVAQVIVVLTFGVWLWYLYTGSRYYYGGTRLATAARVAVLAAIYVPVLLTTMALVAMASLLLMA